MLFQKQIIPHDPENGLYGDCYRTVLACLLDLPPVTVPHFAVGNTYETEFHDRAQAWLGRMGLTQITWPYTGDNSRDDVLASASLHNRGIHFILLGRKGHNGADHNVICKDGAVVWDPSLDPIEGGVTHPSSQGWWWVTFIGRRL